MNDFYHAMTIVLLGDYGVGKSALLHRIVDRRFPYDMTSTIGVDLRLTSVISPRGKIKVKIWDTAGMERFRSLIKGYIKSEVILLSADCTTPRSIQNLIGWVRYIKGVEGDLTKKKIYVVINKWDEWEKVSRSRDEEDAKEEIKKMIYPIEEHVREIYYVSAKTGKNVNDMFEKLVIDATSSVANPNGDNDRDTLLIGTIPEKVPPSYTCHNCTVL